MHKTATSHNRRRRTIIKVGGATLFQPDGFQEVLNPLLDEFRDDHVYVMVGGGDLVEAMRTAHRIYPTLSCEEVHWNCVELLDTTWGIAKSVMPLDQSIYDSRDLARFGLWNDTARACWVRVQSFYSRCHCDGIPNSWMPTSNWNTTTDALAWLLGMTVGADRVVLVKQCECNDSWTLEQASALGVVDSEISRLVNLHPAPQMHIEIRTGNRKPSDGEHRPILRQPE